MKRELDSFHCACVYGNPGNRTGNRSLCKTEDAHGQEHLPTENIY